MKELLVVLLCLVLCGCATIPGNTVAGAQLKSDILRNIRIWEGAKRPGCSPKVVDTTIVEMKAGSVIETWMVESCGQKILYKVEMTPDARGGAQFSVRQLSEED